MVRIIKKGNVAYFSLDGIPFKWENKRIISLEPNDPYHNILMSYERLKGDIVENEETITMGDIVFDKQADTFVEGVDKVTETEEDAVTFMLESEETEGDDKSVIIPDDETGATHKLSVLEEDETDAELAKLDAELGDDAVGDGEETDDAGEEAKTTTIGVSDTKEDEENQEEIDLIISKLEDISSNISKLEDADLEQDADLQKVYLEEIGKKHLLEERLTELGYTESDKKETVVSKILESFTYIDLRKNEKAVRMLESYKMGSRVNRHILKKSRKKLIESIKKTGKLKESGVVIDYHEEDGNFIFSGDLSRYTDEVMLLVPEDEFFEVFDSIVKGIEQAPIEPILEDDKPNLDVKPVNIKKVSETMAKLKEELDAEAELEDGAHYETDCVLYADQNGKVSETVSVGCTVYCPAHFVVEYNKQNDCFVTEDGGVFHLPKNCISKLDALVKANDLVENEVYEVIDDEGQKADVTFEGIDSDSGSYEFKTRMKESFYLDKNMVQQYMRLKR